MNHNPKWHLSVSHLFEFKCIGPSSMFILFLITGYDEYWHLYVFFHNGNFYAFLLL